MIPVIPALAAAFFSFLCSAFVILRIVIPILPPSPLSKRVSPAEFGLPKFRSLSVADKSHIWLASLDIVALVIFIWQAISEATGGPSGFANASTPASVVRIWVVMTIRQNCLLIVASITLLHVRMGRPVSFGAKHWMIFAPTVLLAVTSTSIAAVISGAGLPSLFIGLISYISTVGFLSSVVFTCLIRTLLIIQRNLAALNEGYDPWPPLRMKGEKARPSLAAEDIDAIRDGASWITSNASSRRGSISAWSFSTHRTGAESFHGHGSIRAYKGSHASVPVKSPVWSGPSSPKVNDLPPLPPLPSPYDSALSTLYSHNDPDLFRREAPSPLPDRSVRLDSQTSWLTSTNGFHKTMSSWSYPTSVRGGSVHNTNSPNLLSSLTSFSPPVTPKLASAQVLGGYGYAPGTGEVEKGLAASPGNTRDISMLHLVGWLLYIGAPIALSLPYLIRAPEDPGASAAISVLFVLSVTISSPILALNILFRSPVPIPSGLFDVHEPPPTSVMHALPVGSDAPLRWSQDYKRSMTTTPTVVEGRRSSDVWITNGDAADGKGKVARAMGMLSPMPKISILSPKEFEDMPSPHLPIPNENFSCHVDIHSRSHSETSVHFSRPREDSQASSRFPDARESLAYASKIMIAQRHYSALAQTLVIAGPSPGANQSVEVDNVLGISTGRTSANANASRQSIHLRSRSISSIGTGSGSQTPTSGTYLSPSPPPTIPLPPTPTIKSVRFVSSAHDKPLSSAGYTFGPVDDINEIDALTADVLPLLVLGINMNGMKIKEGDLTLSGTCGQSEDRTQARNLKLDELEGSSPEVSTPVHRAREQRPMKTSSHKRKHYYSLPSLGLGKDGVHSLTRWNAEIRGANLETRAGQYQTAVPSSNIEIGQGTTVFGGESMSNSTIPDCELDAKQSIEIPAKGAVLKCTMSTRFLGLRGDVPHGPETPRESVSSIVTPFSAASTAVSTFEEFTAGLEEDPEAQSTPHNIVTNRFLPKYPPPLSLPTENSRSLSIIDIKSGDHSPTPTSEAITTSSAISVISALNKWSTQAVRPLISKGSVLQHKKSYWNLPSSNSKPGSPGGSLRPLTLLQDRDNSTLATPALRSIRPLTLGKRPKARGAVPMQDENVIPDSTSSRSRNLKPLKLARSDVSKIQGPLRKDGVVPNVVVRPASTSEYTSFVYNFERD